MACLFVSDLHLDASAPQATDQFIALLRQQARSASVVYILGDLFEVWVGDDDADPERERVCAALRAFTQTGVPVFALQGNRDFLLGDGFVARTGCRMLPDPVVADLHGTPVLLTHGDLLCTGDHAYQELRSTVRAAAWQRRFLALPLPERLLLADAARSGSRSHTQRARPQIMDVDAAAVDALFVATGVSLMIHGHTHRPGVHQSTVAGRAVTRGGLDGWYAQGNRMWWEHGRIELRDLPR